MTLSRSLLTCDADLEANKLKLLPATLVEQREVENSEGWTEHGEAESSETASLLSSTGQPTPTNERSFGSKTSHYPSSRIGVKDCYDETATLDSQKSFRDCEIAGEALPFQTSPPVLCSSRWRGGVAGLLEHRVGLKFSEISWVCFLVLYIWSYHASEFNFSLRYAVNPKQLKSLWAPPPSTSSSSSENLNPKAKNPTTRSYFLKRFKRLKALETWPRVLGRFLLRRGVAGLHAMGLVCSGLQKQERWADGAALGHAMSGGFGRERSTNGSGWPDRGGKSLHVTLDIHAIASALYGSTLVSQLPLQDQPQGHHPIRLIHHQSVQNRHRHGHRPPIQHRRDGHRALRPVRQRGQAHRRRDRLVLVRNKSREMIVVVGEAGVGVPGEERELYGGGQERRRREVELVDGEAY
nr:protein trichome birefringence-like 11 [Ipomoea batatas]